MKNCLNCIWLEVGIVKNGLEIYCKRDKKEIDIVKTEETCKYLNGEVV